MAILLEINAAALIREEFERQQFLVAAFRLIALNNLKKADEFATANKKRDELKCFNNILFVVAIIQEIVKDVQLQRLMSILRAMDLATFQLNEDKIHLENLQKTLRANEFFENQILNEKNQAIKNQLLQNNLKNTEELVHKMILNSDHRIAQLAVATSINATKYKTNLSNMINKIEFNKDPIDFKIGNNTVHFVANEFSIKIQEKMNNKFDEGSLTKENFLDQTKKAYREVVEEKVTDSGLNASDNKADIDLCVNENFSIIEKDIRKESSLLANISQGIERQNTLLDRMQMEILNRNSLQEMNENFQSYINNSKDYNFEATQQLLHSSLEKIALIEFANDFDLELELDEELSFSSEANNLESSQNNNPNTSFQKPSISNISNARPDEQSEILSTTNNAELISSGDQAPSIEKKETKSHKDILKSLNIDTEAIKKGLEKSKVETVTAQDSNSQQTKTQTSVNVQKIETQNNQNESDQPEYKGPRRR